jgi:hypothetical protein
MKFQIMLTGTPEVRQLGWVHNFCDELAQGIDAEVCKDEQLRRSPLCIVPNPMLINSARGSIPEGVKYFRVWKELRVNKNLDFDLFMASNKARQKEMIIEGIRECLEVIDRREFPADMKSRLIGVFSTYCSGRE